MDKYALIKIHDIDDIDFDYTIIVEKTDDFEEKYAELERLSESYDNFQEIEDFIYDNFNKLGYDEREITI
jgi:hypothetical protein